MQRQSLFALGTLSLLIAAVCLPVLFAPFGMADDHEIVRYSMRPPTLAERIQGDFDFGRFRPAYYAVRLFQVRAFGDSVLLWRIWSLSAGVATVSLLYVGLCRITKPSFAFLGTLMLLAYPAATTIWWRLGPQETLGAALIALAFYAWLRQWQWSFAFIVIFLGFYKESFALLVPAWIALDLFYGDRQGRKERILLMLLMFIVQMGVIGLLKFGTNGYGATTTTGQKYADNVLIVALPALCFAPGGIVAILHRQWKPFIIVLLWIVPQVFLYAGGMGERFLYPAIMIVPVVTALSLYRLSRSPYRRVATIFAVLAIACVIVQLPAHVINADNYNNHAVDFQNTLKTVAESDELIAVLPFSLPEESEWRSSSVRFLRWYGYNNPVTFGDNCTGRNCDFWWTEMP